MAEPLQRLLDEQLAPWLNAPGWCLALSGGLDSSVLLHLLASSPQRQRRPPLRALHVAHGLQAAAAGWPEHCRALCAGLGVPLQCLEVQVSAAASLEQAARQARYDAFAGQLATGELLLLAQHRDDQAETLLLRLMRGAGVRGLASMPASRPLAAGQLLRPLLKVPRAMLEAYARQHALRWIDDPSNDDERFSRNFLRNRLLPLLRSHWPAATATLARAADHQRDAQQLLDELAAIDLAAASARSDWPWLKVPSLALVGVTDLSEVRQRNLLRYWLAPATRLPDSDHWAGWRDLRDASVDATPVWALADGQLRRAAGRLWWLGGDWLVEPPALESVWLGEPLVLPGNGRLWLEDRAGRLAGRQLRLAYRRGGEQLELAGRGRRDLKRLLNERALPAFLRTRLPLLFDGERLLAVANFEQLQVAELAGVRLHWQPPACVQDLS